MLKVKKQPREEEEGENMVKRSPFEESVPFSMGFPTRIEISFAFAPQPFHQSGANTNGRGDRLYMNWSPGTSE